MRSVLASVSAGTGRKRRHGFLGRDVFAPRSQQASRLEPEPQGRNEEAPTVGQGFCDVVSSGTSGAAVALRCQHSGSRAAGSLVA